MRFKNCTIGFVKSIYIKKINATQQNDQEALMSLKAEYPEIFDAKFMMDLVKNEFERERNNLDDNMIFITQLFQYH